MVVILQDTLNRLKHNINSSNNTQKNKDKNKNNSNDDGTYLGVSVRS